MSTMEGRMSDVERTLERIAAINREMQERNREMQVANREMQVANREMQAANREMRQRTREVRDQQLAWQKADRVRREIDQRAYEQEKRDAQRKWGELANKMGRLVEDIVAPGIPTVFQAVFGRHRLEANAQHVRRTHATDPSREREFDYVVAAGDIVLITETKSTLRSEHIPTFVTALREARDYLPEARDKTIIGALASFYLHPTLVVAGEHQGLLMFGLGTGLLQVLNTPGFQPARF